MVLSATLFRERLSKAIEAMLFWAVIGLLLVVGYSYRFRIARGCRSRDRRTCTRATWPVMGAMLKSFAGMAAILWWCRCTRQWNAGSTWCRHGASSVFLTRKKQQKPLVYQSKFGTTS